MAGLALVKAGAGNHVHGQADEDKVTVLYQAGQQYTN
jgi:hypothetical protein